MDDRYSMGTVLDTSAWSGLPSGTALITRSSDSCKSDKGSGTKTYLRQNIVMWDSTPTERATEQLTAQGCAKIGTEKRQYQEYMAARCHGCGSSMVTREADHDVYCCPPVKATITPTPQGGFAPPGTCPTNCSPRWTTSSGVGRWACDCAPYGPPPAPPVPGQSQQMVQGYRPPWRPAPWMSLAAGVLGGFAAVTFWKRR